MALVVFAVCERVLLLMGAVSIVLCTLGGARSMEGKRDPVRHEICHSMVVCEVKPHQEDLNCTCITVSGSQIYYPGDVGTPTGSLDLVKLIINSVLSLRNARFVYFD